MKCYTAINVIGYFIEYLNILNTLRGTFNVKSFNEAYRLIFYRFINPTTLYVATIIILNHAAICILILSNRYTVA